jgi:hypothetical protein
MFFFIRSRIKNKLQKIPRLLSKKVATILSNKFAFQLFNQMVSYIILRMYDVRPTKHDEIIWPQELKQGALREIFVTCAH